MNNAIQTLLHYVAENDLTKARQATKLILQSSKTQKDQAFCEKLLRKMGEQDAKGFEVPYNLKSIIRTNSTAYEFHEDRYFLSERDKQILDHIKRMYAVGELMGSLGLHYNNAVMLYGASGTGKTTFAQYVAKALDLPFLYVSITGLIDQYLGKTGQNMELVFQFASSLPCVLVLDEIDQIATKRHDDSGTSGEMKRVLIAIMQNLDRLPNNVILIAATNRPNAIDEALMRRFPVKHEIKPLREEEAVCFVSKYLSQVGLDWNGEILPFLCFDVQKRQAGDIDCGTYTPAAITDSLNEKIAAALFEAKDGNPIVSLDALLSQEPIACGDKTEMVRRDLDE